VVPRCRGLQLYLMARQSYATGLRAMTGEMMRSSACAGAPSKSTLIMLRRGHLSPWPKCFALDVGRGGDSGLARLNELWN